MTVDNFSEEKIITITSNLVIDFYSSLQNKTSFKPPTWAVELEDAKKGEKIKEILVQRFGSQKCQWCQGACIVRQVKTGHTKGQWLLQCESNYKAFLTGASERGHTFDYLAAPSMV